MFWLCRYKLPRSSDVCKCTFLYFYFNCSFRNPETKTIEGTLEEAIAKAGGISPQNAGNLQKVGWGRCARTDKGVHAAAQIITLKVFTLVSSFHTYYYYSTLPFFLCMF